MTLRFARGKPDFGVPSGRALRAEPQDEASDRGLSRAVGEVLQKGRQALAAAGIDEAHLEAELLLRHALGIDRARLLAHLDDQMDSAQEETYEALLSRRLAHEPTAYITSHREFYGLDFEVTPAALIPRPETELLVDEARRVLGSRVEGQGSGVKVVDVGTGCGAIAVALAVHLPEAVIVATDTSRKALLLARRNSHRHGVAHRIILVESDLLAGLIQPFDLIVANLPYVPTVVWETLPPEVRDHEPREALDGGPDGLSAIRRLLGSTELTEVCSAPSYLVPGGAILLEIGSDQGQAALALARQAFAGRSARVLADGAGLDRILIID